MSSPDFLLSPCTPTDVPSLVTIYISAFTTTPLTQQLFPPSPNMAHALPTWLTQRLTRMLTTPAPNPEMHLFKITHVPTGTIVAWSRWGYPFTLSAEEEQRRKTAKENEAEGKTSLWPEGANEVVCEKFFGALDGMREKYVDWGEDYILYFLATDPAYERRGLGTMLLNQGIALADAQGKRIYLEATEVGHPLYEKLAWKDIDLVEIDFKRWGAEEKGRNWVMMRDPKVSGAS